MSIVDLRIRDVRNLQDIQLTPSAGMNLVVGDNGSGKSSLLEAITLLGRGKSFRTSKVSEIIRFQQRALTVSLRLLDESGHTQQLGIELSPKMRQLRLNGSNVSKISDLAYLFPIQFFDPGCYNLLDTEPKKRRQFIDWGTFHHNRDFFDAWKRYNKALLQRNSLLRSGSLEGISIWNRKLAEYGDIINRIREDYLQTLYPLFNDLAQHFRICNEFGLTLNSGWNTEQSLEQVLMQSSETDLRYGYTQLGPHRCDIVVMADGRAAKTFMSRGQRKILVLALMLAQIDLMSATHGKQACILVDDITAELDRENQDEFMRLLHRHHNQLFVTTTDNDLIKRFDFNELAVYTISDGVLQAA
ncbi:MAG: DNA replication/repair protein RecF [Gammaproteobacteria bacterium]|nr:DNA replication/repair protein RecF [Gammaproteobacteria bacterium]